MPQLIMTLDSVPTRIQHLLAERLDDSVLLYHPGLTKAIWLSETASIIWELCDGQRSVRDIAAALGEALPDASSEILEDVEVTVRRLVDEGAVALVQEG